MKWTKLSLKPPASLSPDEVDSLCSELVERGAAGTTIESTEEISCYVSGDELDAAPIAALATRAGCAVTSTTDVKEENWNQRCAEVWEPVAAGTLTILPVESLTTHQESDPSVIRIIPGQGFGTGHHPTTRMILETLSERAMSLAAHELSILDFGTGSGILAIGAAKLFSKSVEAIDNDPYAITNALDNVALNGVEHLVRLSTTDIKDLTAPYSLILANVYGEVLTQFSGEVTRLALPGCVAILSGITELVRDIVVDTYTLSHGWELLEERSDNGWHCVTLRK